MLKILGRNNSSNVQKVLWVCGELGLDYEREAVGGSFGGNARADYLAMNPNGLVPEHRRAVSGCQIWLGQSVSERPTAVLARTAVDGLAADDRRRRNWPLACETGPKPITWEPVFAAKIMKLKVSMSA